MTWATIRKGSDVPEARAVVDALLGPILDAVWTTVRTAPSFSGDPYTASLSRDEIRKSMFSLIEHGYLVVQFNPKPTGVNMAVRFRMGSLPWSRILLRIDP